MFCATLRSIFAFSAMLSSRVMRCSCTISLSVKPAARSPSQEQMTPFWPARSKPTREHDIVGAAQCAKLFEDREIQQRRIAGQPTPQDRQSMGQDMAHGAAQELILAALLGAEVFDNDASLRSPVHRACIIKRVKHPEGHLTAQDRHSHAAQALAQFAIERGGLGILQRLASQPLDDGAAQNPRRCGLLVHGQGPYPRFPRKPRNSPLGSKSEVFLPARHFRCTLDTAAKVENRTTVNISRKLILGILCCCVAFQRHYGGP